MEERSNIEEEEESSESEESEEKKWTKRDREINFDDLLHRSTTLTKNEAEILGKHCTASKSCKIELHLLQGNFLKTFTSKKFTVWTSGVRAYS